MSHRFKDEWLVSLVRRAEAVAPDAIEALRANGGAFFAETAVRAASINEEALYSLIKSQAKIESKSVTKKQVDRYACSLIPEKVCRGRSIIAFDSTDSTISVASWDPLNLDIISDVEAVSGRKAILFFCMPETLERLIETIYDPESILDEITAKLQTEVREVEVISSMTKPPPPEEEEKLTAPVIRLTNSLIIKAVTMRASDIHLEHEKTNSIIRFRIDGQLREMMRIPGYTATPLVSRIKIMSDLDVAEHRIPQDGRAKLKVGGVDIGLRVSILPTDYGETTVIRILDQRVAEVPFNKLGFRPQIAEDLREILTRKQGIILVTGPTGSGKTTTLYSALRELQSEMTNIVTVEDPIEYKLPGINQVGVKPKQGLTFSATLRSVLRQDPDVILVGEIRDKETAIVATDAAMTGHLVLSTLHTNDTVGAIRRLSDIGVEPFKVASSLIAVTAQRLVRKLCGECRVAVPVEEMVPELVEAMKDEGLAPALFKAKGCEKCGFAGFTGRIALVELLKISPEFKDAITAGKSEGELLRIALEHELLETMTRDALQSLSHGFTTHEQARPYLKMKMGARVAPVRAAAAEVAPAVPAPAAASEKSGKLRVLVVDDAKGIRIIARVSLQKAGFEVFEAENGEQGLERVLEVNPDLVLLDLLMPELNGHEFIGAIREGLGRPDLPIIMMTASSDEESKKEAIRLGVDDYILKPFKPALIIARIEALFKRKGRSPIRSGVAAL